MIIVDTRQSKNNWSCWTHIENISFIIGKEFWEIRMILDKKYYRTYDGHRDKQQKQM